MADATFLYPLIFRQTGIRLRSEFSMPVIWSVDGREERHSTRFICRLMSRQRRVLVHCLELRDEVVWQQQRVWRLHADAARNVGDKVVAIVGNNAPGMAGGAGAGDDGCEPVVLSGSKWPPEAARNLTVERVLVRRGCCVHGYEMTEYHARDIAGWMNVGIGCGRGLTQGIETPVSDVTVTVNPVHRHAKLDVIGIAFSVAGMQRAGDTYGLGLDHRGCKRTRCQHRG